MPAKWSTARVIKRERRTVGEAVRHFVSLEVEVDDSDADLVTELRLAMAPTAPPPALEDLGDRLPPPEPEAPPTRRRR